MGDAVKTGDPIASFYSSDLKKIKEAITHFEEGLVIKPQRPKPQPLILKTLH